MRRNNMRLVKSHVGEHAGEDLISLYVDESSNVQYYADSELLHDCKTWDNASVTRIVCDTPTKRTYKAIFSKDKRLTAVWLKSLHLHRDLISDVTSIPDCLDTMVTEDETKVVEDVNEALPEMDLDIPEMFTDEDEDLFGNLTEVEEAPTLEVEKEPEVPVVEPEPEEDLFGEEPEMIDVQAIAEEEEEEEEEVVVDMPVEQDIPQVEEISVEQPKQTVSIPTVTSDCLVQSVGGLPTYINESLAVLVKAGISFTVVQDNDHYIISVDK